LIVVVALIVPTLGWIVLRGHYVAEDVAERFGVLVITPTHWTNFAVALAGVAAVLTGLVFVALSVNLERILWVAGLPGRAGETVIVSIGAVVQWAFLLIPASTTWPSA